MKAIILVLSAVLLCQSAFASYTYYGKVLLDDAHGDLHVKVQPTPFADNSDAVAYGNYTDTQEKNGWGVLYIVTNSKYPDLRQTYAAGVLESFLTYERIWEYKRNLYLQYFSSEPAQEVLDFLLEQKYFVRQNITKYAKSDLYWYHMSLVMSQFDGLVSGYKQARGFDTTKPISELEMYIMNSAGDLSALVTRFKQPGWNAPERDMLECSALIKLTPKDLYFGHATWRMLVAIAPRIYKFYYFDGLASPLIKNRRVTFSSMPGFLSSKDDFYVNVDTQLAVMETTNGVYNNTAFEDLTVQSLLCWQRTMVANYQATSPEHWAQLFAYLPSGTYTNQFMILDYKKYTPGMMTLPKGALWIVEEAPVMTRAHDVTAILNKQTYWPSYNNPYDTEIWNQCGYDPNKIEDNYDECTRAVLFRKLHSTIHNIDDFKRVLYYNEYKTDPDQKGSPKKAIHPRHDLDEKAPVAFGGADGKITSYSLAKFGGAHIIMGPTHISQPPFSWSNSSFAAQERYGHPDVFNFDWIVVK